MTWTVMSIPSITCYGSQTLAATDFCLVNLFLDRPLPPSASTRLLQTRGNASLGLFPSFWFWALPHNWWSHARYCSRSHWVLYFSCSLFLTRLAVDRCRLVNSACGGVRDLRAPHGSLTVLPRGCSAVETCQTRNLVLNCTEERVFLSGCVRQLVFLIMPVVY